VCFYFYIALGALGLSAWNWSGGRTGPKENNGDIGRGGYRVWVGGLSAKFPYCTGSTTEIMVIFRQPIRGMINRNIYCDFFLKHGSQRKS